MRPLLLDYLRRYSLVFPLFCLGMGWLAYMEWMDKKKPSSELFFISTFLVFPVYADFTRGVFRSHPFLAVSRIQIQGFLLIVTVALPILLTALAWLGVLFIFAPAPMDLPLLQNLGYNLLVSLAPLGLAFFGFVVESAFPPRKQNHFAVLAPLAPMSGFWLSPLIPPSAEAFHLEYWWRVTLPIALIPLGWILAGSRPHTWRFSRKAKPAPTPTSRAAVGPMVWKPFHVEWIFGMALAGVLAFGAFFLQEKNQLFFPLVFIFACYVPMLSVMRLTSSRAALAQLPLSDGQFFYLTLWRPSLLSAAMIAGITLVFYLAGSSLSPAFLAKTSFFLLALSTGFCMVATLTGFANLGLSIGVIVVYHMYEIFGVVMERAPASAVEAGVFAGIAVISVLLHILARKKRWSLRPRTSNHSGT